MERKFRIIKFLGDGILAGGLLRSGERHRRKNFLGGGISGGGGIFCNILVIKWWNSGGGESKSAKIGPGSGYSIHV